MDGLMRTLYTPIIEPGANHDTAAKYKRGLYNALLERGPVEEWDYLANDPTTVYDGFVIRLNNFQPDVVLTQFHSAEHLYPHQVAALKAQHPNVTWVNWSGDSWAHSLTAPPVLELAKQYDLWLVAAPDVLPTYEAEGIRAEYWNIAFEEPVGDLPDMPAYDVVFLGNVLNEKREALMKRLRSLEGVSVGIYGDWANADGQNVYHFPAQRALYQKATLAVSDNVYPDTQNYVSDRPMQIMASGGAMLLHQHVPAMEDMTGWKDGVHYVAWKDFDELETLIAHWLHSKQKTARTKIVKAAQKQATKEHSWAARVKQLEGLLS